MMSKNLITSLYELVSDTRFRNFALTQNFENLFNEYGINESENAHMLSWFFNPNGSHGLKDVFFKEFLTNTWSMIHSGVSTDCKEYKSSKFYTNMNPLYLQNATFMNAFVDREIKKDFKAADIVICDVDHKTLVVINNRFTKIDCEKAYEYFNGKDFTFFENKMFVSFDTEVCATGTTKWMYVNNEWMINLCGTLIEGYEGKDLPICRYLNDFYQFLTGSYHGRFDQRIAEYSSTLVSNFYSTLVDFKNYKCESYKERALCSLNPVEFARVCGNLTQGEREMYSLYCSYRNTFNTFFYLADLEGITKNMDKAIEGKAYGFERTFIRNGLCFATTFGKYTAGREFINGIFNVELVFDGNKNLTMNLVVNKPCWDKLTTLQKDTIQKNFDITTTILQDRTVVWNKFFKQDWKNIDFSKEIITTFDRVENFLRNTFVRVA